MPEEVVAVIFILTVGALMLPVSIGLTIRSLRRSRHELPAPGADLTKLQAELQQVRDELALNREEMHRMSERQQFVEALLEKPRAPAELPSQK